ncbi:hypothetical protein WN943_027248 [Citrus x changshan-huyou]
MQQAREPCSNSGEPNTRARAASAASRPLRTQHASASSSISSQRASSNPAREREHQQRKKSLFEST